MEFSLSIQNIIPNTSIINERFPELGLTDYNYIKSEIKQDIDLHKIYYNNILRHSIYRIYIRDINIIKWLKVFNNVNDIIIYTTPENIKKYVYKRVYPDYINTIFRKKITSITLKYEINESKLIEDWGNDGCPLYWDHWTNNKLCNIKLIENMENYLDSNN